MILVLFYRGNILIYAIFGMPGSGKSYYVVNEFIIKRLETDIIISNIALSPDISIPSNYNYLEKTEMDKLHFRFKEIMEDVTTSHDEKKVKLSKVLSLYGTGDITIIIDECHLYGYRGRSSSISYIDDLLSIHRHIFPDKKVDFVLITQVPSRLNTEIAAQVEIAVIAIPASQRLITSMLEYMIYGSVEALKKRDKDMRMKRQIIKGDPKVFDMYQSGFVIKGSGDFRKKLVVMIIFILIIFAYVVKGFFSMTSHNENKVVEDIKEVNQTVKSVDSVESDVNRSFKLSEVYDDYRIVCTLLPINFDTSNIDNFFYSIYSKQDSSNKLVCYKKYGV